MTTRVEYTFVVPGIPIGQGNLDAVPKRVGTDPRTGKAILDWQRPRMVHQNAHVLKPWRLEVKSAAVDARGQYAVIDRDIGVRVDLWFFFQRPPSIPKRRIYHTVKPDVDRLIRAAFDAMTGIVYVDDSQVVAGEWVKDYAGGVLDPAGVAGAPRLVVRIAALQAARMQTAPLFQEPSAPSTVTSRVRKQTVVGSRPDVGF